MNRPSKPIPLHELRKTRQELHGKRHDLHDRLFEVCENFVMDDLTKGYKQQALLRELRYLLDYYRDQESWTGIE
jgi:hypothetical protein